MAGMAAPGRPTPIGILLALQIERARNIIGAAGPLTIGERVELLEETLGISEEEAHELVYRVAGWKKST